MCAFRRRTQALLPIVVEGQAAGALSTLHCQVRGLTPPVQGRFRPLPTAVTPQGLRME